MIQLFLQHARFRFLVFGIKIKSQSAGSISLLSHLKPRPERVDLLVLIQNMQANGMTINYHGEKFNICKLSCTLSQKWKPHESVAKIRVHNSVLHHHQVIQTGCHQFP